MCSFFGPTNLVRSGVSPLGILALDTLQRGRRLAERGWVIVPCKDWPSATAYGGCGLDKGLSPSLVCHQEIDGRGPLARANGGSANLSTPGSILVSVEEQPVFEVGERRLNHLSAVRKCDIDHVCNADVGCDHNDLPSVDDH